MEALENKILQHEISQDELLELALLNIEPGHDGFRAMELLREIPIDDARFGVAQVWLEYCYIYELLDDGSLREAVRICDEILRQQTKIRLRAAALLLKATALRTLDKVEDSLGPLLDSIRLEPGWVASRQILAMTYLERNSRLEAEEQLRQAIEVIRSQSATASLVDQMFDQLIAAQGWPRLKETLQNQLNALRANSPEEAIRAHDAEFGNEDDSLG
jgi:tetratricopeptide (TPR) repeat protein